MVRTNRDLNNRALMELECFNFYKRMEYSSLYKVSSKFLNSVLKNCKRNVTLDVEGDVVPYFGQCIFHIKYLP